MSKQEISDLVFLDPSRFEAREHLALSWVRATLTSREGAAPDLEGLFMETFDARERLWIKAAMQGMYFSNLISNTLFRRLGSASHLRDPRPPEGIPRL